MKNRIIYGLIAISLGLVSCEKEIQVELPKAPTEIVVEGYVNSWSNNTYVILSRTVDYFNPDLSIVAVKGATVTIKEGTVNGKDTTWSASIPLTEFPGDSLAGLYFNPTFKGTAGKAYMLEVLADGKYIYGTTTIPVPVLLDSLTYEIKTDNTNGIADTASFLTIHFNEPAPRGNCYRAMYKIGYDSTILAWGDIQDADAVFNDDVVNGIYRHFTYSHKFNFDDTVNYYFSSIDRPAYNFWESYSQARSNGGPFSTPVQLKSTVHGGIGSFTGMGVSFKRIIIKRR